jgi:DNA-directed RNA polymerase subunit RPC12/RpoP
MYEDEDFWPFKCPYCLHEFTEQIVRINAGTEVRCPDCRTRFTDHHKQFAVALAEARNGAFNPWRNMVRVQKPK